MKSVLFVPDLAALRRKLADPPPRLARVYGRFRDRLASDAEFRRYHIFLPALLGERAALDEAKGIILGQAADSILLAQKRPGARLSPQDTLDRHIWCVAPRAMRMAAYFTWLDAYDVWSDGERRTIAAGLMDFFHDYVVPVLRSRTPAGHNQQLSMVFCSAAAGHVFAGEDKRAGPLRDYAMVKLKQSLGLMPSAGYSGEGSTYQSDVVSGLVMWAGIFLEQTGERDVWTRRWEPNGTCMASTLRMESNIPSCGGLLPPWDNYGWQKVHNFAARTLWAGLSGNPALLEAVEAGWDEYHHLAWLPDDRMWTLLYWPKAEDGIRCSVPGMECRTAGPVLAGWSEPAVGAAVEHLPRRLRVMTAWDECSANLQGIGRAQVNPNHLMVDMAGEPVTGDGWDLAGIRIASGADMERTRKMLTAVEHEMVARQYGSFERWMKAVEPGFIGASCSVIVDGWDSYFPRHARRGQLIFERREPDRHTYAAESAAYYQPAFDVTRMRRTVSIGKSGVAWIVDDIRAGSPHVFGWRAWLRNETRPAGSRAVRVDLKSGAALVFGWFAEADGAEQGAAVSTEKGTMYPSVEGRPDFAWPGRNTVRCDMELTGRHVRFVVCLVPDGVEGLQVRRAGEGSWEAVWPGGSDHFAMPPEVKAEPDPEPVAGVQAGESETQCDLGEDPYCLPGGTDAQLLAALDRPPADEWRRTGAAMQALTVRGFEAAMPKIEALLLDAGQDYTVHSIAAWCLGREGYVPALGTLRRLANIPEPNTALRAAWAAERIEKLRLKVED